MVCTRVATIWLLQVLLYGLVCGHLPFNKEADIIAGRLCFKKDPTKGEGVRREREVSVAMYEYVLGCGYGYMSGLKVGTSLFS